MKVKDVLKKLKGINHVLESICEFPLEDQEIIVDVMAKRIINQKRKRIVNDWNEARKEREEGKLKTDIDQLFE
ncbi:MAG: hypothetical protein IEMM0008_1814 [bacterium]|nr:MAG: hypothetical protein IEMM0008_1814 [bacterium]